MRLLLSLAFCVATLASSSATAETLRLDPTLMAGVAATTDAADGVDDVSLGFSPQQVSLSGLPLLGVGHGGATAQTAHGRSFGIGLQAGSPSALTVKFGGPHQDGFVLGVGAGFGYGNGFGASLWLHADYLFHFATLLNGDGVDLSLYAGPGLFATIFGSNYGFGYRNDPYFRDFETVGFGVRAPIGLSMAFDALPLEIYLQLDPAISIFPGVGFGIGGSLGFRFYFS